MIQRYVATYGREAIELVPSASGGLVTYDDHQAELAKKDEEIRQLRQVISACNSSNLDNAVINAVVENSQLQQDLSTVIGEAVKISQSLIKVNGIFGLCSAEMRAARFLNSPRVAQWRKEQEGK
ncbi:MAG: hypothetical protein OEY86_07590 [Nitrospira sp.]|nr:hypothetical protein [Nitrospira sp.]